MGAGTSLISIWRIPVNIIAFMGLEFCAKI